MGHEGLIEHLGCHVAEGICSTFSVVGTNMPCKLYFSLLRRYKKSTEAGYLPAGNEHAPRVKILYDESDFTEHLLADISSANRSILVDFSFILPSSTTRRILEAVKAKGKDDAVQVRLQGRLQKMDDRLKKAVDEMFSSLGLSWDRCDRQRNHIIIDWRICWYGEIQPLAMSRKSDRAGSIMRIVDENTARELGDDRSPLF